MSCAKSVGLCQLRPCAMTGGERLQRVSYRSSSYRSYRSYSSCDRAQEAVRNAAQPVQLDQEQLPCTVQYPLGMGGAGLLAGQVMLDVLFVVHTLVVV